MFQTLSMHGTGGVEQLLTLALALTLPLPKTWLLVGAGHVGA